MPTSATGIAVLAIMSWSVGVFLYGATGILVSLRLMLYEFGPEELTPPYWVSMGALAITVLAGARIVEIDHLIQSEFELARTATEDPARGDHRDEATALFRRLVEGE